MSFQLCKICSVQFACLLMRLNKKLIPFVVVFSWEYCKAEYKTVLHQKYPYTIFMEKK